MGKLINGVLLLLAIYIAIALFISPEYVPGGALWLLVTKGWSDLNFFVFIEGSIALIGTAIVIGGLLTQNDLAIFGGISSVFFSFGLGFFRFYEYLNVKFPTGSSTGWVTVIFFSPLIVAYLLLILDFWRGKD